MLDMEYSFEFGRKMKCPHCHEEISWVKGYMGHGPGPRPPIGTSIELYALALVCPRCETIINIQQAGSANTLFGGKG